MFKYFLPIFLIAPLHITTHPSPKFSTYKIDTNTNESS